MATKTSRAARKTGSSTKTAATKKTSKKTTTKKRTRAVKASEVPLGPSRRSVPDSKNAETLPAVGRPRKKKPSGEDASGDLTRLSPTQRAVVKDIQTKAKQRSDKARASLVAKAKSAGFSAADLDKVLEYIKHHAPLVICFNPDKSLAITTGRGYYASSSSGMKFEAVKVDRGKTLIDAFLIDSQYRSQFETGISSGSSSAYPGGGRDGWEKTIFQGGYHKGKKFKPQERPKYGALNAAKVKGGPARGYGTCMLVLKPGARTRASVTRGNSSGCSAAEVGTPEHFNHVLNARGDFSTIMEIGLNKKKFTTSGYGYIEAQIHGPVEFDKDVAELIIDTKHKKTAYGKKLVTFAKKYGIKASYESSGY